jgi:DNA replication protein DnaC
MAYSESVLRNAKARLADLRQREEDRAYRRTEGIYAQYPRLREIDMLLRASVAKVVAATFAQGNVAEAVKKAKEENLALQQERAELLKVAGLREEDLEAKPICEHCGGTGYMGEKMCTCLHNLCREEQKKELSSLLGGQETFERFNLSLYPAEKDAEYGVSPRVVMTKVYDRCVEYVKHFSQKGGNLLFSGATGLGKTFLSACIARGVAEQGYSVVYDTAGKLFADFETAKFYADGAEREDYTRKYLQCDLLIIDDLGTEMVTQFTQSALYQVVNTRLMEGRATLISTNLTSREIEAKYPPQIASRLLGSYELLLFLGNDLRRMK